MPFIVRLLV